MRNQVNIVVDNISKAHVNKLKEDDNSFIFSTPDCSNKLLCLYVIIYSTTIPVSVKKPVVISISHLMHSQLQ